MQRDAQRQLDDLALREVPAQVAEHGVADAARRVGHPHRVVDHGAIDLVGVVHAADHDRGHAALLGGLKQAIAVAVVLPRVGAGQVEVDDGEVEVAALQLAASLGVAGREAQLVGGFRQ